MCSSDLSPRPPSSEEAAATSPAPEAEASASPERPPSTVVIDAGGGSGGGSPSLIEASRRAREQRKSAGPPVAVIDNENLADYARRGNLTFASPAAGEGAEGVGQTPGEEEAEDPRDEAYWRGRARELRTRWREAADQIGDLETQAEALRLRFYAEEDVYSRDTRIKPAWDRVLDRLAQARVDSEALASELDAFLDEGRKSGALPGWLREGAELEPEAEPAERRLREHESTEPPVAAEPEEPPSANLPKP